MTSSLILSARQMFSCEIFRDAKKASASATVSKDSASSRADEVRTNRLAILDLVNRERNQASHDVVVFRHTIHSGEQRDHSLVHPASHHLSSDHLVISLFLLLCYRIKSKICQAAFFAWMRAISTCFMVAKIASFSDAFILPSA